MTSTENEMPFKEFKTLMGSLESKSHPSTAARAFTEPTRQALAEGADIEGKLWNSWNALIGVAADIQHESQEALVDVVRAIQGEVLSTEGRNKITIWGNEVMVWKDMPLFGPSIREAWNRAPGTGSKDDFSEGQWINLNAFIARLTFLSSSVPAFDFSLYAIWTLRAALEGTDVATPRHLLAAKVWFLYASRRIEQLSKEGKEFDGKIASAGEKYKTKAWKGFNAERLNIWQATIQ